MVTWSRTSKEELEDRREVYPWHMAGELAIVADCRRSPWVARCGQFKPRCVTVNPDKVTCGRCKKVLDGTRRAKAT